MSNLQTKLSNLMTTLQFEDAPSGGSVVVYHRGKLIAECSVGEAMKDTPWNSDTLSLNYSTGKGVLVTLIHVLVSEGLLEYDTPIIHYWPSFDAENLKDGNKTAKSKITLRDVLTHRANLFNIQSITQHSDDILDWEHMIKQIEQMPPSSPRNEKAESCYSALVSGWVLGGLIEKVTHKSLNSALNTYLAQPLGAAGEMQFGVAEGQLEDVATLVKYFDAKPGNHNNLTTAPTGKSTKNPSKSAKPTLKQDTPSVTNALKTLPSYNCWLKLVEEENKKQHSSYHQSSNVTSSNVTSANFDEVKLTTQDITKLYFEMGSINLIDYKNTLWPSGKDTLNYYEDKALLAKIPAANNVATARALAKMYAMIANDGEWEGKQLIKSSVIEELAKVYVTGSDAIMAATAPSSMHWRLGYHRLFTRCHDAPNAFGHMGYNGSAAWCDTDRQLAVAFVHNYRIIMSTDIRQFAINEAILSWVDENRIG